MFVNENSNIFDLYKNTNIVVGVSLIENHHLKAIVMIQRFASHCNDRPIPFNEYRTVTTKWIIYSIIKITMESSKEFDPFLCVMAT